MILYEESFGSRMMLGTSRYPSPQILKECIESTRPAFLTVSLRRQLPSTQQTPASNVFWDLLKSAGTPLLPNTAGCHSLEEVIATAEMAREVFETDWIKLELIGDDYTLQPDTLQLPLAAQTLIQKGFKVLPYCTEDLILCRKLVDVGCQAVMPWAAPIGTGKGPMNPYALRMLREHLDVPMIVDAGLGLPSHAAQVMEWGFDGVLLNTAVALSQNPLLMAKAFDQAVKAGRMAHEAGAIEAQDTPQASTPVLGTPFWHQS